MLFGYGSARRGEISVSGGEVSVRLERFLYQSVEMWVVIQVPPGIGWWRRSLKCSIHADQRCRRALGQCWWPIVRPNAT
jgi:hypothetical protein